MSFSDNIKQKAYELGFSLIGIAKAEKLPADKLDAWLGKKYYGKMEYMPRRRDLRLDPSLLVANAKSIIVTGTNYYTNFQPSRQADVGVISRYAWGDDYHDVVRARLKKLLAFIQEQQPNTNGRVFVDSAPVMEKVWAQKAGLGWQGKNSNLINPKMGSYFFLGEVIIDAELDYDEPFTKDYCGTCTTCMDACPTQAIVEPGVVDSSRCISYLTIELKPNDEIPSELGPHLGNLIFGCDVCQDVCPWNKKAQPTNDPHFQARPHSQNPPLSKLQNMTQEEFSEQHRKSPIKRTKLAGLLRNVRWAMRNRSLK